MVYIHSYHYNMEAGLPMHDVGDFFNVTPEVCEGVFIHSCELSESHSHLLLGQTLTLLLPVFLLVLMSITWV